MTALLEKLIDRGEAEAIVLARELSAILLICMHAARDS
jgi:predicted nucleic acid-binding protein